MTVDASLFEGEALERLKQAAEEIAFLTGRGYAADEVNALVARHRRLEPAQQAVLVRAACSEEQYKRRAVKEMLPEDIARRPLLVDGDDVLDAITTALAGGVLVEGVDQTVQLVAPPGPEAEAQLDAALDRIGPVLREMRPSKTKWFLAEGRHGAAAIKDKLLAASKKWKVPVEVEIAADPKAVLRKSANVATSDPAIVDACKSWCNLAGPVVATIPTAKKLKLQ